MKGRTAFTVLLMVFCLIFTPLTVWASGGEGKNNPLAIDSATVSNGEKNVNTDREIKFIFNKNVNNINVVENNRKCFSMTDSHGNSVPIEVVTFDDQLEREKRNDIIIKPQALKEAEEYTITIGPDLQAKNGVKLGKEIKYTFSTVGYVPAETGRNELFLWIGVTVIVVIFAAAFIFLKRKQ